MSVRVCQRCGTSAPADFVICPKCHALFFADQLGALHREATAFEANGDLHGALEKLRAMEPMLPRGSVQAKQLVERIATLEPKAGQQPRQKKQAESRGVMAGIGAAIVTLLTKGKLIFAGLTKLPTLVSFFVSAAFWEQSFGGWPFALVFLLGIYLHEVGHMWAFRRYAIPVTALMFVPGLGAFTRGAHYPKSLEAGGDVALAGPIWGGVAGFLMLGCSFVFGQPWLAAAAVFTAELNFLNLLPIAMLDGGKAVLALSREQLVVLAVIAVLGAAFGSAWLSLSTAVGVGLFARLFIRPPAGPGNTRVFVQFLATIIGLLLLRFVAQQFMPTPLS